MIINFHDAIESDCFIVLGTILTQNESANLEEKLIDIAPATSVLEPAVTNDLVEEVKEKEAELEKEKIAAVAPAEIVGAVAAAAAVGAVAAAVSSEKKGVKAKTAPAAKKPATSAAKGIPPKAPTTGKSLCFYCFRLIK